MQKKITRFLFLFLFVNRALTGSAQISTQDSLALVSLYNSTNGANWATNSGWLTSVPVSNWFGITTNGTNVTSISLDGNNLVGTIPSALGNLSALGTLVLSDNALTGSIPNSFGNLTSLTAIVLTNNQLTDSIPPSLGNLPGLAYIDLSVNQLTDSIPSTFGNLTSLGTLYLYSNNLTGSIPSSLTNLASLGDLEINNNQLSGSIPVNIGNMVSLNTLDLNDNRLSGSIPSSLGNLSIISSISLYNNQLSGSIPSSLGNLTSLSTLNLDSNQLSGSIPASLGNLSGLQGLGLSHNQLSGSIPSSLALSGLFFLDLSYNQLSGTVPVAFGNLQNSSTAINNNKLTFDSLEQVIAALPGGLLADSAQGIIPLHVNGSLLSVSAGGTLANDTFHWYRNGALIATIVGDSTFTAILSANYFVTVSNKIITPATTLVLHSDTLMAGTVLPVTLLNFTGNLVDDNTQLQWQVANETNTSYYNVQRSTDGTNYITVGKVMATNSSVNVNYQFTDNISTLINNPVIFYRLQEMNMDGSFTYSHVITVTPNSNNPFIVYPNPATGFIDIIAGSSNGNSLLDIFDINGKKVIEQQQQISQGVSTRIDISSLPSGVYFIRININGSILQQKFIRQ